MADITIKAAYGSVVEDEGHLFIGFAAGEDEAEGYVLFRQPLGGGPVWFEVNDETFGAEDGIARVEEGTNGFDITLRPEHVPGFGWATAIAVRVGPGCEDAAPALDALRRMLAGVWAARP